MCLLLLSSPNDCCSWSYGVVLWEILTYGKYSTQEPNILCAIFYAILCAILYTILCTILYTILCTILYGILCTILCITVHYIQYVVYYIVYCFIYCCCESLPSVVQVISPMGGPLLPVALRHSATTFGAEAGCHSLLDAPMKCEP